MYTYVCTHLCVEREEKEKIMDEINAIGDFSQAMSVTEFWLLWFIMFIVVGSGLMFKNLLGGIGLDVATTENMVLPLLFPHPLYPLPVFASFVASFFILVFFFFSFTGTDIFGRQCTVSSSLHVAH
jgi:hypothetical protein